MENAGAPVAPGSQSALGGFSTALRTALNEAGTERVKQRAKAMSAGGFQPKTPGTLSAVSELLRSGVDAPIESVYSDTVGLLKEKIKAAETNPDQFRVVQDGIYDLKNNTWVVAPKPGSDTGPKSKALSRTDVDKLGLPVSLVGTTWGTFLDMVDSNIAPSWFEEIAKREVQSTKKMSLAPATLNKEVRALWDQFRAQFTSNFDVTSSGSGGDLSLDDIP